MTILIWRQAERNWSSGSKCLKQHYWWSCMPLHNHGICLYFVPVILTAFDFVWGNTCPLEDKKSEVMAQKSPFISITVCPLLLAAFLPYSFTCSWLAFCLGLNLIQLWPRPQLCITKTDLAFLFPPPRSPRLLFHSAPLRFNAAVSRWQLFLQRLGWVPFPSVAK